MLASTATDIAALVTAGGVALASVIGGSALVITALRAGRIETIVRHVSGEVTTLNGKTLAVLGDNDETRRILAKPTGSRTVADHQHLENAPDPDDMDPPEPELGDHALGDHA